MDLAYMPDALPYGGFLRPQIVYRDYEQPWNNDHFHLGKPSTRSQEQYQQQLRASKEKDHCQLCRNNKRRSLAAYIRSKSKSDSCNEIHEEDDDDNIVNDFENKTGNVPPITTTTTTTTTTNSTSMKIDENESKPVPKSSRFSFRFKTVK